APVTRSPESPGVRWGSPDSRHPVVAGRSVGPVARGPDVVRLRTGRLLVFRQRGRRLGSVIGYLVIILVAVSAVVLALILLLILRFLRLLLILRFLRLLLVLGLLRR